MIAIVTGSAGLIGSETARFMHDKGMEVVGVDNDMRRHFFGEEASTARQTRVLSETLPRFRHLAVDIRDQSAMEKIFSEYGRNIALVVHTAAQPSHDWAAKEPLTDFSINAGGTLLLLELTRKYAPDATFIFTSSNKVYGDAPNAFRFIENEKRWEPEPSQAFAEHGFDETLSIDQSKHSLFGAAKVSADILTQEYGRYFGLKTVAFRAGCLTGPAHAGAEQHGFLAYLIKCAMAARPYKIHGYKGKQVRDCMHAFDLVNAFWHFHQRPRPGAVYNIGGSRHSHCSVIEAIEGIERISGKKIEHTFGDDARPGDHIWWISNMRRFRRDYPDWTYRYDLDATMREMIEAHA